MKNVSDGHHGVWGRRLLVVVAVLAVLAVATVAYLRSQGTGPFVDPQSVNRLTEHAQYNGVDPNLAAAAEQAAADDDTRLSEVLTRIVAGPPGLGGPPERYPSP